MKYFILLLIPILFISCLKPHQYTIDGTHTWQKADIDYYLNKEANELTEEAVKKTFDTWD